MSTVLMRNIVKQHLRQLVAEDLPNDDTVLDHYAAIIVLGVLRHETDRAQSRFEAEIDLQRRELEAQRRLADGNPAGTA